MPSLERKIPPPVVGLLCFALMYFTPGPRLHFSVPFLVRLGLAACIYIVGVAVGVAGFRHLRHARTTVSPVQVSRASALVTTGIYSRTRNPMYLAIVIALFAWSIFLQNPVSLLFIPACIFYLNRFQIIPEERALAALFPADSPSYIARVRRWL